MMKIYITKILLLFLSIYICFFNFKKDISFYDDKEIEIKLEGYILNEGLINIKRGSKYKDLISLISYYDDTDLNILAMDYPLYDGQILSFEKINRSKININTAGIQELDAIPGVGEATANKILSYREENGNFKSIEEIKNVNGIGDKKYENMKDSICVN